jgi:hypothetical protein
MKSLAQPNRRVSTVIVVIALGLCGLILTRKDSSRTIASGEFHQVAHKGVGDAAIVRLDSGERALRLVGFRTYPASDLEVRLIAAPDAFDNETVEKSDPISLGPLRPTDSDQVYLLPYTLDLTNYRAVAIWSLKYGVNFTTAPLALR